MSAPNLVPPGTTGGGTPVGGSGTPNTITKWNTSTTLNDSVITQSGSNVGIGMSPSLAHKLDVAGQIGGSIYNDSYLEFLGNGNTALKANATVNVGYLGTVNVTNAGLVGIGTTSPATKTEISGDSGVSVGGSTPIALRISATDIDGGAGTWSLTSPFTALQFYSADTSGSGASVRAQVGAVMEQVSGGYSALAMYTHTVGIPLERMRISSGGNVGIGTTTPGYPLEVAGNCAATSFISTSDERDKNILGPVAHGLAFVEALRPIAYQFRTSREDPTPASGTRYGFSAQSVLALEGNSPAIIDTQDADKLRIHDAGLVPILVNALQELNAKFEAYVAAQEAKCL